MTDRKEMVKAICDFTGYTSKYLGVPSCAYQIGKVKVLKDGALAFDEEVNPDEVSNLIHHLLDKGFKVGPTPSVITDKADEPHTFNLTIKLPKLKLHFTPEVIENLNRILEAKGALIQKALGLDSLPEVEDDGDNISFPWFKVEPDEQGMMNAYGYLVCALCDMAKNQKRITAREQHPTNEKYAFRGFLLRLGFIGNKYKATRKILLANLSGSSAWKDGAKHE